MMKRDAENIINKLLFAHPPLQNWCDTIFEAAELKVDVLRLDQMHPQLGGNKWMKLRLFLQQALIENKSGIITKGGPWSNHVHATAYACQQLGLSFCVWIKGHEGMQTAMLDDVKGNGSTIQFVNRQLFYDDDAAVEFASENNLLYVPMGGADEAGIQSSTQFLTDLHLPKYHYAACAVGTATSFGGLAFTPQNFETVLSIEAGTKDEDLQEKVNSWQQELPNKKLLLNTDYSFGGFARHTPELIQFANEIFLQTGIPTDVVYTAKLFYAVKDLATKGFFKRGYSVMVLHSGGLQGNRSLPIGLLDF